MNGLMLGTWLASALAADSGRAGQGAGRLQRGAQRHEQGGRCSR